MKSFKFLAILLFAALASSAWARTVIIDAENQTISDATTWEDVTVIFAGDGSVTYSSRITISGSVKPFYIAAWLFPKNCGSAAVLTSALSHQTVWLQERCGNQK
ncbi:hypothetical protein [Fibrobacter sp. UWP2]|uniref:hypothetical protein n=1 Tax=Fibrobacter sp. UWP2 TaxID=1896216 RepID=UPI00091006B8|nr:hypothetical protein [Fibrobacter sp. UWP2]SHJ14840.1 hypothetical protein SAMN05720471_11860 [Fibrobacter sp. UWP2]